MTLLNVVKPGMWAVGTHENGIRGCIEAANEEEARKVVRDMGPPWVLCGLVLSHAAKDEASVFRGPWRDVPMTFSVSVDVRDAPLGVTPPDPYEDAIQKILQSPSKFVKVRSVR